MGSKRTKGWKHLLLIFVGTFLTAALVGIGSELLVRHSSLLAAGVFLLAVIGTGILFDIIGMAATAATEAPHHARAANRVFGAQQAVYLIRNADVVANFSNDIVGDVAGTLSGVTAATIVLDLIRYSPALSTYEIWLNTGMLALAASLTITGKAAGKTFAIQEANEIIALVGRLIATVEKLTGWTLTKPKKRRGRKNEPTRKNS
ncbi:hypothetical protein [Paradesulfitobacterium ferrireducens]|uniref:hypothetical protein n=1 Tax=Paradesulfitobacterium ferrireducens TaxID=2816476 RepID=UPI001A8F09D4|nr:hypothetical protein [Paradesulfitobacterium ferrireducens]